MRRSPTGKDNPDRSGDLAAALRRRVVGQPAAISAIVPYVQMYEADLAPEGRPVGVFLLLGPTGTGKTRTVEALAEVLHGGEKNLLRIDCGEFQMEHEVAKLIGAPPGYLGHRETHPMISQQKLNATTGEFSNLSIVLFDEIEKAAPSLRRLLLGVLDKAILHLGDNTVVNFENSLIFLTSNLGARDMHRLIRPDFGYQSVVGGPTSDVSARLEKIGVHAVRRRFSPEFVNRIDAIITYEPLGQESLRSILSQHIEELQEHIYRRRGEAAFELEVTPDSRDYLLRLGTSPEFGARELKRTIHRCLTQPLAAKVANGEIPAGSKVRVALSPEGDRLEIVAEPAAAVVSDGREPVRDRHGNRDIELSWTGGQPDGTLRLSA